MEHKAFEEVFEEVALEMWPDENERRKFNWVLGAARTHKHWGQGKEVTRSELETVIREVLGISIGGGGPPEAAKPSDH